ncbi:unnamed protein product [Urochloa humidicola]
MKLRGAGFFSSFPLFQLLSAQERELQRRSSFSSTRLVEPLAVLLVERYQRGSAPRSFSESKPLTVTASLPPPLLVTPLRAPLPSLDCSAACSFDAPLAALVYAFVRCSPGCATVCFRSSGLDSSERGRCPFGLWRFEDHAFYIYKGASPVQPCSSRSEWMSISSISQVGASPHVAALAHRQTAVMTPLMSTSNIY